MVKREHMRVCTVPQMFNESVIKYGERRCQWFKTGPNTTSSLTYSEVGMIVRDLTGGLLALGMQKGDRAAIMSYNCPQWLWSDFAILCSGGITVTIYPTLSPGEMKFIVNNSGSRFLFIRDEATLEKVCQVLEGMPLLEKVIVMDDNVKLPPDNKFMHLSVLKEIGMRYLHKHPYAYEKAWHDIKVWDPATIIYTSGTTGQPKGAVHTHQTIMTAIQADNNNFAHAGYMIDENDINLSFLPLSHSYERQCGQMVSINAGCTIAYAEKPQTIMADLQIFKPTWFCCVPRIFERIYMAIRDAASSTPEGKAAFERAVSIGLKVIEARMDEHGCVDMGFDVDLLEGLPEDLKEEYRWADQAVFSKVRQLLGGNFRIAFSASAALSAELCKLYMAMGIRICEGYGLTETMNAINFNSLRAVMPGSVGPTLYFSEEKIAEDGELLVRGKTVFLGYYKNPEATAEAFTEDGFFKTGDIAVKLPNGYYKIVDRKKSIIVLDTGKNVARAKVESKFATARYIEQICVLGDDRKFISAIVVPKFDYIMNLLKAKGIEFDQSAIVYEGEGVERICVKVGDDFVNHEEVRKLIEEDIAEANKELEDYERIKKYHISNRRFLESMEELTPTLKTKHRNIIKNFQKEIEAMYS
ncbi:long-chain acyl-CoA synthetase [Thermosyntropha lipolytica DSM 11003]|uniref:Long-chain acyl-CoA synthetase n=1 Tax=Thermosyntropha lipolytica DSM 11003 TaxID=1123382 RepID=A0A1M5K682_9FIRM|nr:long-chain fatty acid--CoA ligase [Thermosyntropha lipolytica]SHG48295.1 long-chain acyl-CoA synthetase [Thermosyntropha lipolytica DSM 11003]